MNKSFVGKGCYRLYRKYQGSNRLTFQLFSGWNIVEVGEMGMSQRVHNELILEATLVSVNNEAKLAIHDMFLNDGGTYFFNRSPIIRDLPLLPMERNSWRLRILDLGVEFDELGNILSTLYEHVFRIRFDVGLDSQCGGAPEDVAPIAQAIGDLSM
jgi:hypothetical protein